MMMHDGSCLFAHTGSVRLLDCGHASGSVVVACVLGLCFQRVFVLLERLG